MSPLFSPVSAGGLTKATVTGTTGSPTIDSATRAGKTIYKFTGSGSITIGTAGTCEVLVVGGGGYGSTGGFSAATWGGGGGGGGGVVYFSSVSLNSGSNTVTIGAGGTFTSGLVGSLSSIGYNLASIVGVYSGSGQGNTGAQFGNIPNPVITAIAGQGNNGGVGVAGASGTLFGGSGGGGGGSAVGGSAVGTVSGNGGAGFSSSITGTSVAYAGGGGGGAVSGGTAGTGGTGGGGAGGVTGTAGTANTGGGGGGGNSGNGQGSNGGSGIVIVVIG